MAVGIRLGSITDEIGSADFFHAFFSTISANLEPDGWGTQFPTLMNKLYQGEIGQPDAEQALRELDRASEQLRQLPPDRVVWDVEDRTKLPPWGGNISSDISDLSNYFVTSTGRDLISLIREVLEELRDRGGVAKVVQY